MQIYALYFVVVVVVVVVGLVAYAIVLLHLEERFLISSYQVAAI